ncbi:MAG: 4Fe-4S ferredoxin [Cyanobacteria bacterium]|nr:4Fe-4S ferredoxin [Cyanobacteriota bacterium]MDA0866169.1 4Fe-4S ferredoxin [Cyanobacteriota bacterium]
MSEQTDPIKSLQSGCWFKLICGASYQHLPVIRNLALAYTLAGVDCIDVAADPTVIKIVQEAVDTAAELRVGSPWHDPFYRPWLMISINDGEDPHFRKATFNPEHCPADCSRPCISTCPTAAITFAENDPSGVISSRCYGCGRCFTVCPPQVIEAENHVTPAVTVLSQVIGAVDAIEIHTQIGRQQPFEQLFQRIQPYLSQLKLLSISCPNGDGVIDYLWQLYRTLEPLSIPLVWQTDGRPMSGDIGSGTTHATIRYGQKMLQTGPPGYIQLAGGTNHQTVPKLSMLPGWNNAEKSIACFNGNPGNKLSPFFGGVAYGSYARKLLQPIFSTLEMNTDMACSGQGNAMHLETFPDLLEQAVQQCRALMGPLKGLHSTTTAPPLSPVIV